MHIEIVPFMLMWIDVCDYAMQLVCAFPCFWGCIENESVDIFYKDVWGRSITLRKENKFEGIFVGDGVMVEGFPNGGWPCRKRVENISIKKMFKVFSCGYKFLFC